MLLKPPKKYFRTHADSRCHGFHETIPTGEFYYLGKQSVKLSLAVDLLKLARSVLPARFLVSSISPPSLLAHSTSIQADHITHAPAPYLTAPIS